MSKVPKEGGKLPSVSLPDQSGKKVSLSAFKGKKIVLYFYPKDMTPGCTQEAIDFQAAARKLQRAGAVVVGVSKDSVEKHRKFAEKYELKFPLLSDEKDKVCEKLGVWKEKSLYGRKFMGIERTTFVIDGNGKVLKVFPKVKVKGHVEEVLKVLKEGK